MIIIYINKKVAKATRCVTEGATWWATQNATIDTIDNVIYYSTEIATNNVIQNATWNATWDSNWDFLDEL